MRFFNEKSLTFKILIKVDLVQYLYFKPKETDPERQLVLQTYWPEILAPSFLGPLFSIFSSQCLCQLLTSRVLSYNNLAEKAADHVKN